jgi:hypothetical protein
MVSVHGGDDCVGEDLVTLPREKDFVLKTRRIGGRIEGTTLDEYGKPISIVTILGGENSTHSFADGRFVLENIRGDVITIVFTHPDYTPVTLEGVQDGAAGLVVHMLKPRPSIVLVVRDADSSEPVTKIRVEMTFADEKARPAPTSPVRLAKDGRYEVRLPEGATSVTVSAVGLASQTMPLAGRNDGEVVPVLLAAGKAK